MWGVRSLPYLSLLVMIYFIPDDDSSCIGTSERSFTGANFALTTFLYTFLFLWYLDVTDQFERGPRNLVSNVLDAFSRDKESGKRSVDREGKEHAWKL